MKLLICMLATTVLAAAPSGSTHPDPNLLVHKGCTGCHSVASLGLRGGSTGPDLSNAAELVHKRYGMTLEAFLKTPKGPMADVLGSMIHLSAADRANIVELLERGDRHPTAARKSSS